MSDAVAVSKLLTQYFTYDMCCAFGCYLLINYNNTSYSWAFLSNEIINFNISPEHGKAYIYCH